MIAYQRTPHPAGIELEQLADRLCTLAGRIAAATAEFLRLVGEFDERQGWAGPGLRSCAHWLSWRCGISLRTARDHVRVARRLRPLPVTTRTFAEGRLSYSKVRAICRVATPATEGQLVETSLCATASQVERMTRCIDQAAPEQAPFAPEQPHREAAACTGAGTTTAACGSAGGFQLRTGQPCSPCSGPRQTPGPRPPPPRASLPSLRMRRRSGPHLGARPRRPCWARPAELARRGSPP